MPRTLENGRNWTLSEANRSRVTHSGCMEMGIRRAARLGDGGLPVPEVCVDTGPWILLNI